MMEKRTKRRRTRTSSFASDLAAATQPRVSESDDDEPEQVRVFGTELMSFRLSAYPKTGVILTVYRSGAVLPVELRMLRDQLNLLLSEIEVRRGA